MGRAVVGMTRELHVTFTDSKHCAYVSGYGSRELITDLRGRPPVWSSIVRAWHVTERTARDLVAVAEARGRLVTVTAPSPEPTSEEPLEQREQQLW